PLHGRIRAKEPRREAPEGQEQDSADEFRVAGRGGRRHEGPPRNRPGRGSRRGASPEVEGDDDDDGIDEDGRDRGPSEQEVGIGPGDDQADRSPHAAVREAQGLPDARGEVFGHAAERSACRLRLPRNRCRDHQNEAIECDTGRKRPSPASSSWVGSAGVSGKAFAESSHATFGPPYSRRTYRSASVPSESGRLAPTPRRSMASSEPPPGQELQASRSP